MELNHWFSLGCLLVATISLLVSLYHNSKKEHEHSQTVSDKLDNISEYVKETRTDVQRINATLNSHTQDITRIETRIDDHARRLENLES